MENLTWNDLLTRLQHMNANELGERATVFEPVLGELYHMKPVGLTEDGDLADGELDKGPFKLEISV